MEGVRDLGADIRVTGCTNLNDVDAGEVHIDSRTNDRVYVDLDNPPSAKPGSENSALESTHDHGNVGHDIAYSAEVPGAN